jgi:hypothetical protein
MEICRITDVVWESCKVSQNDGRQTEDACDGMYAPVGVECNVGSSPPAHLRDANAVSHQSAVQARLPTLTPQRSRRPPFVHCHPLKHRLSKHVQHVDKVG